MSDSINPFEPPADASDEEALEGRSAGLLACLAGAIIDGILVLVGVG